MKRFNSSLFSKVILLFVLLVVLSLYGSYIPASISSNINSQHERNQTADFSTRYYVDASSGNDSNPGTSPDKPWQTLDKVNNSMSLFSAGTKILFKRSEEWVINDTAGKNAALEITCSGNEMNPITFSSYGNGNKPVFRYLLSLDWFPGIRIMGHYLIIEGFRVTGFTAPGILIPSNTEIYGNNTIRDNEVDFNTSGIYIFGENNKILNNYVHDTLGRLQSNGLKDDGVGICLFASNNEIAYNFLERCCPYCGGSFEFFGINGYRAVSNNQIHHNFTRDSDDFIEVGGENASIQSYDNLFYRNISMNNNGMFTMFNLNGPDYKFDVQRYSFFNNTIIETSPNSQHSWCLIVFDDDPISRDISYKNNIIYLVDEGRVYNYSDFTHENNLYYFPDPSTITYLSEFMSTKSSTEKIFDPLFMDFTNDDYHLSSMSPAINTGINIPIGGNDLSDFDRLPIDSNPDIGAFEFHLNPVPCTYFPAPVQFSFDSMGGWDNIWVDTQRNCLISAQSNNPSWLKVRWTGNCGTGCAGRVSFSVDQNNSWESRTGTISIGNQVVTINQGGCSFSIDPISANFPSSGGTGSFSVTTEIYCNWDAVRKDDDDWIIITTGSGTGDGTVSYSVGANSSCARYGTIMVGGLTFTVYQEARAGLVTFDPPSVCVPLDGGSGEFRVYGNSACIWDVESMAPSWIIVNTSTVRNGEIVSYQILTSQEAGTREGKIRVGNDYFTIRQAGMFSCPTILTPIEARFPSGVSTGQLTVTTLPGCPWSLLSYPNWVVPAVTSGTGTATVSYTVTQNIDPQSRTGAIQLGGDQLTVIQAGYDEPVCTYTLTPESASVPQGGGSGSFTVNTQTGCAWTAAAWDGDTWIHVSPATGTGPGVVNYTADANPNLGGRIGKAHVGDGDFTITQPGTGVIRTDPPELTFDSRGGVTAFWVLASGLSWTAQSNAAWVTITSGGSGTGNGVMQILVDANPGDYREGTISIKQQSVEQATVRVRQYAPCTYSVSPAAVSVAAVGGTGSLALSTRADCEWGYGSAVSWVTLTVARHTGSGTVRYAVAQNTGVFRKGQLWLGYSTVPVSQAGAPCTLSPSSGSISGDGGGGSFGVAVAAGCGWTATTATSWIHLGTASGAGPGTVTFTVDANPDAASRQGVIEVGDQAYTLTQGESCVLVVEPLQHYVGGQGGTIMVNVTGPALCAWTVAGNPSWITPASGSGGTGPGSITFTVAANPVTSYRYGTLTVGGQTVNVQQEHKCVFTLSPASAGFNYWAVSNQTFTVSTAGNCCWMPIAGASWIHVNSGSHCGNGTVTYSIDSNEGASYSRQGTVAIGDQVFTITQLSPCGYTFSTYSATFGRNGGNGSFTVTATRSFCQWTVSSNAAWLRVTSAANPTGSATVTYTVDPNPQSGQRSGIITAGGIGYTVNQTGQCLCAISPSAASVAGGGGSGSFSVDIGTCSWQAVTGYSWIHLSGASGTGVGTVSYTADPNYTMASRQGTITVAGQTFTLTQSSGCTYSFSSSTDFFDGWGGQGNVIVSTANQCPLSAASSVPWISITGYWYLNNTYGYGNAVVYYSVEENPNGSETRQGTITVGGQSMTITQGPKCSCSVSETAFSVDGAYQNIGFSVWTDSGCYIKPWSGEWWIQVGSCMITGSDGCYFVLPPNSTGHARQGTIHVGDQTITVYQAAQ